MVTKKCKMNRIFLIIFSALFFYCTSIAEASAEDSPGKEAFLKNCAVCHAQGGNIINSKKTLKKKDMNANGVKTVADIIKTMRSPGPGMTQYDSNTIPDKDAEAIASYIMNTFRD
jgi:cytochrome c6